MNTFLNIALYFFICEIRVLNGTKHQIINLKQKYKILGIQAKNHKEID
jgi:hypothetical protein